MRSSCDGPGRPLVILMYHAVTRSELEVADWCFMPQDVFRRQMEHLSRRCTVRALTAWLDDAEVDTTREPVVAVTFDDAFRSTFDVAFPILQRFKIPATVFIPTAFVDSVDCLWFCKVNRAVAATTKDSVTWGGEHYDLSSTTARAAASARIQGCLKRYPQRQLLEQLRTLGAALEQDVGTPVARDSPYAVLDVHAIERMAASGLVEFGAHTHTHAILSLLSPEERAQEIRESVTRVRGLTARPCAIFAYPNGRRQDYDETAVEVLRGVGVRAAVTAVPGLNDTMTPRMELRRTGVGSDTTLDDFEAMVHDGRC